MLRRKRMFEPQTFQQSQDPVSQSLDEETSDDGQDNEVGTPIPKSRFAQLFGDMQDTPQGPSEKAYSDFLAKGIPNERDYKPGKINRLAAILGGASEGGLRGAGAGIKTASEILDKPYQEGLQRHQLQGQQLEKAAEIESKNLGRKASVARTIAQEEAAAARDKTLARHYDAQDQAALIRAKGAGFQRVTGADGHTYLVKPNADGTVQTLDAGKHGESLPEKTRRELEKFKVEEGIRQGNRVTNIETQAGNTGIQHNKDKAADAAIAAQNQAAIDARTNANPQRQNEAALLAMRRSYAAHPQETTKFFEFQKDAQGQDTQIPIALKPGDPDDPIYRALYKDVYGRR